MKDPAAGGAARSSPRKKKRLSWQLHKRRLQYQLLTGFGKELPPADDLYVAHEQRFLSLLQKLLDIRQSLEYYRTKALPEYCAACAALGADVWCVVSVDAVGKGTDAERFRHAMCAINETKELKSHYFNADEVLAGALRFLDIHINAMRSVKSQIEHRKHVKLEFDCYERKVARLCELQTVNVKKLERNQAKLQRAKDALQVATFDLYRVFAKYESERDTMLNGELEMVRQVMNGFYSKNASATNFVIPEDVDRASIEQRTQEIYTQMVAKELEHDPQRVLVSPALAPLEPSQQQPRRSGDAGAILPSTAALSVDAEQTKTPLELPASPASAPTCASASACASALRAEPADDDDLADRLRTIQLSRPTTTEHLETAYVRDAITPEEYTETCTKLISQFKTAETALRLGGFLGDIEAFISQYRLDCPRALERLVRIGVPATVVHNSTNRKADSVNVAQTVQNFITLMDVLKLNIRAVDEIQPLLCEMMTSLTQVSGLPADFQGRDKMEGWLRTLNTMRASDEIDDDQARQLSFDLERAYSSFMAFLNK
ncbi:hypothetical protein P43SY_008244 [Pythium insidiosum]|uniref:Vacuolar protein sorting-associated protein 28 homolog n=1 Tax=Pythium insidiosum TaxID=114742 RepID=A0AAD5QBE2_PYTIN|nr:hypothetical protein P43SY_008244 [Pythium insidiosum]